MRLQTSAGVQSPLAAANTARALNPYLARGVRNWRRIECSSGAVAAPAGGDFAGAAGLGWGVIAGIGRGGLSRWRGPGRPRFGRRGRLGVLRMSWIGRTVRPIRGRWFRLRGGRGWFGRGG